MQVGLRGLGKGKPIGGVGRPRSEKGQGEQEEGFGASPCVVVGSSKVQEDKPSSLTWFLPNVKQSTPLLSHTELKYA